MIISTASDLHIGKLHWGDFGIEVARSVANINADVMYFGGDLAETNADFKRGLELLAKSPAKVKLFTLGNNDLQQLCNSNLGSHYDEMQELIEAHGFHLLDKSPYLLGDVAFVGNIGWYDGTLWNKFSGTTDFPNKTQEMRTRAEEHFGSVEFKGRLHPGFTSDQFYSHCNQRLTDHLDSVDKNASVKAVVLGIHFVPSKIFLKEDTAKYAYLNWFMGAKSHEEHYKREKVILGFTGHTHRYEVQELGRAKIYNISGPNQPNVFEVSNDEHGYKAEEI